MRVLITGLCGFIGHHVAEYILNHTDWQIVGIDRIDATSTLHRLHHIENWQQHSGRVTFVWHDLRAPINAVVSERIGRVSHVMHLAASTHVDRSITDPLTFVQDNVMGTAHILEWWRRRMERRAAAKKELGTFMYFGTDEIFGAAPPGTAYKEFDRFNSTNPYSSSKAAGDQLACAYANTYKIPAIATCTMNVIGERQHAEKFLPGTIRKILAGEKVLIHSNAAKTESGSRFYIHASNVARALCYLLQEQTPGGAHPFDRWNIVGEKEVTNLQLAELIASLLDKPLAYEMIDFHNSRPGHDLRYALDGAKLSEAGFSFPETLEQSIAKTVKWFVEHPEWLKAE